MRTDARPPAATAADNGRARRELLEAAGRVARLTADWYPEEYRFVSAELFAALLALQAAAGLDRRE